LKNFLSAYGNWRRTKEDAFDLVGEWLNYRTDDKTGDTLIDEGNGFTDSFLDQLAERETIGRVPTWKQAFDLYMVETRKKKPRTEKQERDREKQEIWPATRVAEFLGKGSESVGWDRSLDQIPRGEALTFDDWYRRNYPNVGVDSWNKVAGSAHKIFKKVNNLLGLNLQNPFSELSRPTAQVKKSRAFSPEELKRYGDAISRWKNSKPELHLITALMIATGCRTSCAWGLTFNDLHLSDENPIKFVWFRTNEVRGLYKGMHDRPMVIEGTLLDDLRAWAASFENATAETPLFPGMVGMKRPSDSISRDQTGLLRELGIKPPAGQEGRTKVSGYSTRHTFVTRANLTRVRGSLREFMVGHQSKDTSSIHRGYVDLESLEDIRDALAQINAVTDWASGYSHERAF